MSKRIVSFLLAFYVVLTLLPIPALADEAAKVAWNVAQTEDAQERKESGELVAPAADEANGGSPEIRSDEEFAELLSTGGHTQAEAVSWAESQIGKPLDYDGAWGAQCVDLIMYYYSYLGQSIQYGNAEAYRYNLLPSGWSRYTYNSSVVLQPGDIAVWKPGADNLNMGHVGIITSAWSVVSSEPEFTCVDQNAYGLSYCYKHTYKVSVLDCIIRPDFSGGASSVSQITASWGIDASRHQIGETDATLAVILRVNGASISDVSRVGIYLYNSDGQEVASKGENISYNLSYLEMWYYVNGELGYTLTRNAGYCYRYFAVIRRETHYSDMFPIRTDAPSVSANGSSVTVSWKSIQGASHYDVYLVQAPWGWEDIKYSGSSSSPSYTFYNVAVGDYAAFVIARPNADNVQSSWNSVKVESQKYYSNPT